MAHISVNQKDKVANIDIKKDNKSNVISSASTQKKIATVPKNVAPVTSDLIPQGKATTSTGQAHTSTPNVTRQAPTVSAPVIQSAPKNDTKEKDSASGLATAPKTYGDTKVKDEFVSTGDKVSNPTGATSIADLIPKKEVLPGDIKTYQKSALDFTTPQTAGLVKDQSILGQLGKPTGMNILSSLMFGLGNKEFGAAFGDVAKQQQALELSKEQQRQQGKLGILKSAAEAGDEQATKMLMQEYGIEQPLEMQKKTWEPLTGYADTATNEPIEIYKGPKGVEYRTVATKSPVKSLKKETTEEIKVERPITVTVPGQANPTSAYPAIVNGKQVYKEVGTDKVLPAGTIEWIKPAKDTTNVDERRNRTEAMNLRKELDNLPETKEYKQMLSYKNRIDNAQDNAVGDLSLIYSYMKMLDPGSVVREGEFATAQNAAGIPDKIRNLYNKSLKGERLNQKQREAFKTQANLIFEGSQNIYNKSAQRYRTYALQAGVDPESVAQIETTKQPSKQEALEKKLGRKLNAEEIKDAKKRGLI